MGAVAAVEALHRHAVRQARRFLDRKFNLNRAISGRGVRIVRGVGCPAVAKDQFRCVPIAAIRKAEEISKQFSIRTVAEPLTNIQRTVKTCRALERWRQSFNRPPEIAGVWCAQRSFEADWVKFSWTIQPAWIVQ
jgi:hypothetical protein